VDILGLIHGEAVRAGVFFDAVESRGHRLEEWSFAWTRPLPRPLDDYGAVIIFGGAMHADQDSHHPWLRDEDMFIQRLFHLGTPVLGVCLGAQLLAKAARAPVYPASLPEIGWHDVELTGAGSDDPVLGRLPERFKAFQWHFYAHGLPGGADELARSPVCTQAFRLGDRVWGVQFHPEVTFAQVEQWVSEEPWAVEDSQRLLAESRDRIGWWNDVGRGLCGAFVEVAERAAAPA
jgi:GMP synthase-like glutamine amidotransferase